MRGAKYLPVVLTAICSRPDSRPRMLESLLLETDQRLEDFPARGLQFAPRFGHVHVAADLLEQRQADRFGEFFDLH